jgi:hypothetical protein
MITVNGNDFVSASQIEICAGGGGCTVTPITTTFVNSGQLTATITAAQLNAGYAGTGQIAIKVNNGNTNPAYDSNQTNLKVTTPIPVVTSISPTTTPALSAMFTLTVNGSNFLSNSVATWCANPCTGAGTALTTTMVNSTQIQATVPASLVAAIGSATIAAQTGSQVNSTTNATFTISNPTPSISSISPTSATAGSGNTTLVVTGSNFLNGVSVVTWCATSPCTGSTTNLNTVVNSATQLTATIPANLLTTTGSATVGVTNTGGGTTVNAASPSTFTISAPTLPTVTSLSPSSTTAGTPNTITMTVTGTNFINGSVVTWCNFCSNSPANLGTAFVSSTQLTAQVPMSLLTTQGSAQVGVSNGSGMTSTVNQTFTINPKPSLTNLSPTSAVVGQSAFTLSLTGTNFPTTATVVNWTFNSVTTPLTILTNTATSITATVPANLVAASGTATIAVTDTVTQSGSNTLSFSINPAGVTSISPSSTTAGTANSITITVNGTNFVSGSTVTWCNSCTTPVSLATTFVTATQLTAVIPSNLLTAAGSAQVGVNNGSGTGPTTQTFTINPKPVLSSLNPPAATTGQGSFNLTLTGTNFPTTSTIVNWTFNGTTTPLTSITSNTSTSITVTVPANLLTASGMASLAVTDSVSQVVSNSVNLTISSSGVSNVSPASAVAGTANSINITVTGTNFVSGTSKVTWCNACTTPVQLSTTFVSATQMTAVIPANLLTTAGTVQIGVINGSVQAPGTVSFTISPTPILTSLSQTSASAGQAALSITLTGSNFATTSPIANWTFNGQTTPLTITANSASSITATIAASLLTTPGTAMIAVSDSVSQVSSNSLNFTINGPTVSSLSPSGAVAGTLNPVTVTVTGTNFVSGSIVTWCNGCGSSPVQLTTTYIGGTLLSATIPVNLLTTSATVQIGVINTASGTPTSTQPFTIGPGPTLTTLSATSAIAGQASFSLTLTGTNFPTPSPVVNWKVGTTNTQLAVTASTSTSISATVTAALLANAGNASISVTDASSGVTSNALTFTITGPVVTSISPTTATAGTTSPITLSITGSNFVNGSIATWCNACGTSPVQLTTTYVSGSQIMATIPASLLTTAGTTQVGVINSASGSPTTTQNFIIAPKPTLTSLSQQFAIVNAASAINLTLTGSNFPVVNPVVNWTFQGQTTSLTITVSSASSITAIVPTSLLTTAGTATVSVSDSISHVSSNSLQFVIASGPGISPNGLTPSSIAVGSPTFSLMISGSDFAAGDVLIWTPSGGTPVTIPSSLLTVGSGGTSITATINASLLTTVGSVSVSVQDAIDNVSSNLETFSINGPTLTSISPTGTTVGTTNSTTLTVNGANFVNGTSMVTWCNACGSTPIQLTTTFVSANQLTAVVPASLITGQGSVQIGVVNGNVASTGSQFFTIGAVGLTNVTPASASAGSPGFSVSIVGSNFTSTASVTFTLGTTTQSLTTTFVSPTQLQAFIPTTLLSASGSATIAVQVGTSTSNSASFTIVGPTISTITPTKSASGVGAFPITITGANFLSGSVVQWTAGGTTTPLSTSFQDASDLVAIVNAAQVASAGTALISVLNTGGAVSPSVIFTVGAAPSINGDSTGLNPTSVTAGSPATQIVIQGTNFQSGSIVVWNNSGNATNLATGFVSTTEVTATIPATLLANPGTALILVQNPGTVNSNSVAFTIAPGITPSITPPLVPSSATAGGPAFQLAVMGSNFVSGSVIQWNAGATTTALATSLSGGQLSALVPASLITNAGTVFVSVLNPGGALSTSVPFTVSTNQPTINSTGGLAPSSAIVGSSSFQLAVTGTGFVSGSTVQWNAGSSAQALQTVFVSPTNLTAIIPTTFLATSGTVLVTVSNPGGAVSNAAIFSVTPDGAPVINLTSGISPSSAVVGAPSFLISVTGSNFFSGSVVRWIAGSTATPLTTSFLSSTQLNAVVPATLITAAGTPFVNVQNPGGEVSNSVPFTVGAASGPTINSDGLNPSSAAAGTPSFQLVVSGTNFVNGATVQWNAGGTPTALATGFVNSTTLNALIPANLLVTPGIVFVSVTNPDKTNSNTQTFTVTGSVPVLTSISPTSAPAGSASLQLMVTGSSFVSTSLVQWNGTSLPTTFVNATTLMATVSSTILQNVGTAFVSVTNPGGSATSGTTFTVSGPTLMTISPTSATSGSSNVTLTLTGTNFVTGSVATWNGTMLPTSVTSATSATAQVSSTLLTTAGTFIVVMTNPGGTFTASQFFTVNAPAAPTVSGVTPTSAIAGASAFQITVAGSGFVSGSTVQWNGAAVATSFVSPTQLTALINSNLIATAGTANITVQIPGAPLSTSLQFPINPPAITTLNPTTVAAGGPAFVLTVTGGNFIPGSTVQWNGTNLPSIYSSATQLMADVSASLITSGGTASITVQNGGTATSAPATFTIGPFTLVISTTTLPDAVVGTGYSQVLTATGGSPPYMWAVTAGNLPAGLTLDAASGTISGTPTAAVTGNIGFTVTDSVGRMIPKTIALRSVAQLTITTTTPLNSAPAGVPFSQIIAASGGTPPYTWSMTGSLPSILTLNTSTGQISGTPTVPGTYSFSINVADSRSQSISVPFSQTVTASGITIGGITTSSTSGQQLPINLTLAAPYTVPLTGTLTAVFTSAVGATDPAIQFSSGGLTANFTIPAGTTQAVFGTQQSVLLITGTTAGTITVTASLQAAGTTVTPTTAPAITTTIAKAPPVITGVTLTTSGTSLVVSVTGYSNTRDMTTGNFQFIAAPGTTLTAAPIAVNLAPTFSAWYQSSASLNFGSQFTFSVPISFTGNIKAVGSVSVTLVNSAGTSAAATATRQ